MIHLLDKAEITLTDYSEKGISTDYKEKLITFAKCLRKHFLYTEMVDRWFYNRAIGQVDRSQVTGDLSTLVDHWCLSYDKGYFRKSRSTRVGAIYDAFGNRTTEWSIVFKEYNWNLPGELSYTDGYSTGMILVRLEYELSTRIVMSKLRRWLASHFPNRFGWRMPVKYKSEYLACIKVWFGPEIVCTIPILKIELAEPVPTSTIETLKKKETKNDKENRNFRFEAFGEFEIVYRGSREGSR